MKDTGVTSQLNTTGGANTYRFKSFKQRADEIEINVSRRIVRDFDEPEDESYFAEGIKKWNELNCTKDYTEFLRRITKYQRSLAQVLYHKNEIIQILEDYMSMDHELVVEAILDLVTLLARDLQDEILPHYEGLVQRITPLIRSDSVEIVEAACNALAYLFKYLARGLIQDLRPTFNLLSPMLGIERQKANVRRFTAESMAFLIRKLRGATLQQFVEHTVRAMLECPASRLADFRDGLALLFFECMRNVDTRLHSRASAIYTALLHELYKEEFVATRLDSSDVYVLVASVTKLCLHYTRRESAQQLWAVLFEEFDAQARAVEDKTAARIQPCAALLGLLTLSTIVRKGSRVESYKPLLERCKAAFSIAHSLAADPEALKSTDKLDALALMASERIKWLVGLLLQCDVTDMVSSGKVLLDLAVSNEPLSTVLSMALTLARLEWAQWNQILLPYLIRLTVSHWESDQDELLLFWTQLFQNNLFKHQAGSISSAVTSRGQVIFPNKPATADQPSVSIPSALLDSLLAPVDWESVASQQQSIPTGERDEFTGFDEMDQDDDQADNSMLEATDTKSLSDALATKSALLSVLAHVAADSTVLLGGLSTFVTQLVQAIVQNTAQIAQDSEFLQAMAVCHSNPDNSDVWDDDASRALGLFAPRESRMYWGSYHQLFAMVGLLGRALVLMADTALHAPPSLAADKLIDAWCLTLDQILPTHAANSLLMAGMYKIADALKFASSPQRSGGSIQPETRLKLEAALSLQQLELIMPLVEGNLSSMQSSLRLHTLQLLSAFEQPTMSSSGKTNEACLVVQMGIELESAACDLDSYKHRLNHLRQMAVIASNGRMPKIYRNVFPSLSVAQYSLNFSYIWPEVTKQLGLLAGADQELFWTTAWSLVQRFGDERQLIETGPTPEAKKWLNGCMESWAAEAEYVSPLKVDGHTIECPNFARVSRVYDAEAERLAAKDKQYLQQLAATASCPDTTRIDYANVQRQLMTMLAEVGAAAAEAHSKPVVLTFLAFIRYGFGWTASFFNKNAGTELGLDVDSTGIFALEHSGLLTERTRRVDEQQCILWLKLLAKFRNPQQLHRAPVLYSLFLRMLTRGDNELQRHALECVLAWHQSSINPYADNLRSLVDEKRFHDELKTFDLAVNGESINVMHREQLMPVVLRILHGQMMVRHGKSSRKDGMRIRRSIILNAMVGITQDELRFFVGIGLETFRETIARATPREIIADAESNEVFSLTYNLPAASNTEKADSMDVDDVAENASDNISEYVAAGAEMDSISSKAQVSFLHLLSELIRNLGIKATPVFHESLAVLLSSIAWAQRQLDIVNDELADIMAAEQTDAAEQSASDNDESDIESVASDDEDVAKDKPVAGAGKPGQSVRGELEHRKSVAREIRQLAVKCLTRMFTLMPPDFSFTPYMPCIYEVAVDPRIDNLATENSQNSSALLLLLKSWTLLPKYFTYLIEYNPLTVPMLLDILVAPKVQPAVVTLVLNVLQVLLDYDSETAVKKHKMTPQHAEECGQLVKFTIRQHVSRILSHMRVCFANVNLHAATSQSISDGGSNLIMHQIHILSRVAEYATEETQDAKALLDMLLPALRRPNSVVPVRAKGDVLNIMLRFIPLVLSPTVSEIPRSEQQHLLVGYLNVISSSFGRLRLDSARKTLTQIMTQMARVDRELRQVTDTQLTSLENAAWIIEEINAYSKSRLNEPDHDRRLAAYEKLNEELWNQPGLLDAHAWTPLLHNLVFYAQEQEELATRSNAAFGLARFVSRTAQAFTADAQSDEAQAMGRNMKSILLPSIKHMLASKHEAVQIEFLNVLRKAIRECGQYFEQLKDLLVLDTKDEEANFFYNILHIQTHRRTRAMRRLRESILANVQDHYQSTAEPVSMDVDSDESDDESSEEVKAIKPRKQTMSSAKAIQPLVFNSEQAAPISPTNIRAIIMPLLENWALAEGAQLNHDLSNEAIQTIGVLAAVLPWSQYNATLHKYMAMAKKTPSMEKRLLRLIMGMLDHFHFDLRHVKVDGFGRSLTDDAAVPSANDVAVATNSDDGGEEAAAEVVSEQSLRDERIHKVVVTFLLPELKKMVAETNEEKLILRAPVAMAIVRILTALPVGTMNAQLPGVLTTICNMLRAKAQSARNATRETLVRILKFLGSQYFGFLVKELQASLNHGAQKHILSYTIYALLKEVIGSLNVGDLDYTLEPLIDILIQDIFGQTGDDKDAEDWISKIREAKVHHGPDCFEMLASVTRFDNIRLMLAPVRDILRETDTPKRTKVVDNVLRRISIGISHNRAYDTKTVLIFCHNIINQYLAMSTKGAKDTQKIKEEAEQLKRLRFASNEDYVTVHVRRTDMAPKRDYLQANAHRFVQFGLEILYHGLKRERFDTKSAEVLGMLDPFVDLTGDGLYSRYNSIISLCCKIWAIMVRLPLPSVPNGIPVVIKRLFAIFRQAASTNSDMIQNCFKLLASLLRSKHAEKMMADYEPEELDMSETAANEQASTKKPKKGKKGKSVAMRISADCMKNSLISEEQLRDLIDFIRPDIEETERQSTAFSLIRAILTRRMIVDSLYKLLDTIRELMISAQDAKMRELCRLTWFQFLMDYPLGERRLANAMSFIVQNASGFVFESGRASALEIMGVIIDRFADELLLPNAAEPFFLGLVLIIAKDESSQCREMAMHLLPTLIARFDQPRLARAWLLLDQWTAGITSSAEPIAESDDKKVAELEVTRAKQRELGRAALQCYGIIVEPLGEKFAKRVPAFLSVVDSALTVSLKTWKEAEMRLNHQGIAGSGSAGDLESIAADLHSGSDPHNEALMYWETAYLALNAYGRLAKSLPQRAVGNSGQSRIWLLAVKHLNHPHAWVRLSAARLIGAYVGMADPSWMLEAEKNWKPQADVVDWEVPDYSGVPKYVLLSVQMLKQIAQGSVIQLNSRFLSAELGNQAVKNLYFIARCFLTAVPQQQQQQQQQQITAAESVEQPQDTASSSDSESESDEDDIQTDTANLATERSLSWLINRVGNLARTELIRGRGSTEKRSYCFKWFAAVISLVPPPLLTNSAYIMPIISPLYRTTQDSQLPANPVTLPDGTVKTPAEQLDEIKALANEVIRLLQDRMGVTAFSTILVKVQKHVNQVRDQRREQRKQLAVIDPELHSKKKLRKHESARRKRQEKMSDKARKKTRLVVRRAYNTNSTA
ncbi:U3 snoRNP protein [Coemansia sp. RSA 2336]|nr:U3 snoRNP protein [Coemansia sp. RSA 2336]